MARELYERCTVCAGSGRVRPSMAYRQLPGAKARGLDGCVECTVCGGTGWLKVGISVERLEMIAEQLLEVARRA
jgi:uncharacterized protein with PIN domain